MPAQAGARRMRALKQSLKYRTALPGIVIGAPLTKARVAPTLRAEASDGTCSRLSASALEPVAPPATRGDSSMSAPVSMTVNGRKVTANVEPRTLLVQYLRDQLGL